MSSKLFSYARKTLSELIESKTIRRQNVQLFRDLCQPWFEASSTRIWKFVKTQIFFLRIRLASTRIQRSFRPYPEIFENAIQSGNFFIRYEYVYVWTVVSRNFRIRLRHSFGSRLHGEHYKQTWRTARL